MKALQDLRLYRSILQQLQLPIIRQLPTRRHLSNHTLSARIRGSLQTKPTHSWRRGSLKRVFERHWQKRFQSTDKTPPKPDITSNLGSPSSSLSFSQRMRKLSREYGWAAFGIYMGLSALDFPFCFLAVRALGTDRIGHWEHEIISGFWKAVAYPFPQLLQYAPASVRKGEGAKEEQIVDRSVGPATAEWSWGVEEAEKKHKADATIWTQLALAYAVHKSFIFLRVPLTVAVTPKVVKTLRGWGWNIGKRKPKTSSSSSSSSPSS